jgi:Cu-Zn family superoxide dismutase
LLLLFTPVLLAACADSTPPASMGQGGGATAETVSAGTFRPGGATAITYDEKVVPSGATAQVTLTGTGAGETVRLAVTGLLPSRAYGAHLHTKACAATGAAAGPHYQHSADPKASASPPSVDPRYANPRNEVWLDLSTDAQGSATVTSVQEWEFAESGAPRSLILHAERTRTADGVAGTAGARVACLTLNTA